MFTHASTNLSTLTMKALLIILPKRSLIECRQCYRKRNKQKKKKQREDKAQKGNKVKASWGP